MRCWPKQNRTAPRKTRRLTTLYSRQWKSGLRRKRCHGPDVNPSSLRTPRKFKWKQSKMLENYQLCHLIHYNYYENVETCVKDWVDKIRRSSRKENRRSEKKETEILQYTSIRLENDIFRWLLCEPRKTTCIYVVPDVASRWLCFDCRDTVATKKDCTYIFSYWNFTHFSCDH